MHSNCPYCNSKPLEMHNKVPDGQPFGGSVFNKLTCPNSCIKTKFWIGSKGAHRRWAESVRQVLRIQEKTISPLTKIAQIKNNTQRNSYGD